MPNTTITLAGNPVIVVTLPPTPGLRSATFDISDAVAIVTSPFTGQTQAQQWPGADMWAGTLELPPLRAYAPAWQAFLMELRGRANAFQIGDPMYLGPQGTALAILSVPVADMTVAGNAIGATTLNTGGWPASQVGLLLPGDLLQIGYRRHCVLDVVNSDAGGKAAIAVWPSLRDVPGAGQGILLRNPQGLWRLAANKRTWSSDYTRISHLSFQIMEYR